MWPEGKTMKQVLMIAYFFPPLVNSGTQRPLKFAKYLRQFGWEPTVLSVENPPDRQVDAQLMKDLPADIRVIRVPMLSDRIGDAIGSIAGFLGKRRTVSEAVSWRLRERWQQPDLYALWRPTATRAALRMYEEVPFDAIYATGFPWTSLIIGRDVSQRTSRPLIADFRDPWVGEDLFSSGSPQSNGIAQEHSVVRQASVVVSTSNTMTAAMVAAHPDEVNTKFVTITNGYDPDDLRVSTRAARNDRFRIVYAGAWKAGYGLDDLYAFVQHLVRSDPNLAASIEVMAAGFPPGAAKERGLSQYVTELGVLPHIDAVALMKSADILFLQNPDGARQSWCLPGKIFEYLATGRPVLAVTDPDGEAGRLVRQVGGGIVVPPGDSKRLEKVLTAACRARRLDVPPRKPGAIETYERASLSRRLAEALNDATTPL
jgi:glycosyltransferase involved in cell wall biosynthesis